MKPADALKLIGDVRDLQIVDSEGRRCGIADDFEFDGAPGGTLTVAAILVGPGAYEARLPAILYAVVKAVAGHGIVRIPWREVDEITSVITLCRPAREIGLGAPEVRAAAWVSRLPLS